MEKIEKCLVYVTVIRNKKAVRQVRNLTVYTRIRKGYRVVVSGYCLAATQRPDDPQYKYEAVLDLDRIKKLHAMKRRRARHGKS